MSDWQKVDFDNMAGKTLIHNRLYRVRNGECEFNALFQYCEYEYWWICPRTKRDVRVEEFKIN